MRVVFAVIGWLTMLSVLVAVVGTAMSPKSEPPEPAYIAAQEKLKREEAVRLAERDAYNALVAECSAGAENLRHEVFSAIINSCEARVTREVGMEKAMAAERAEKANARPLFEDDGGDDYEALPAASTH